MVQEVVVVMDQDPPEAGVSWGPTNAAPVPPRVMFRLVATDPGRFPSGVSELQCRLVWQSAAPGDVRAGKEDGQVFELGNNDTLASGATDNTQVLYV